MYYLHKNGSKPITQFMGDLRALRITPSTPFQHVGIDYVGFINSKRPHITKAIKKTYNVPLSLRMLMH